MYFALVQIVYWISLSTWFGGVLFIAAAAPVIFRTVRENNPILPTVLSVNLEGQHATLLAGTIVSNLLSQLSRIELACAGGLLTALIGHWFVTDVSGENWLLPLLRCALYLVAVVIILYDWRILWPRIASARQLYIDHADEPDVANSAKDDFDRFHRESVTLLTIRLALLLALILFSAGITPRRAIINLPKQSTQVTIPALTAHAC